MVVENIDDRYTENEPQILGKNLSELTLCYLICPQDAANAFLGALMITDFRARPIHFSFASPVRPTAIQKILFGSSLNSHVKIDVIAQKLLSNIPRVPDVLFVDDMEILAARQITKKPTACLKKSTSQDADPSKLSILDYKSDSNVDQEIIGQVIAHLENLVDLVEPFSRMRQALKEAIKSQEIMCSLGDGKVANKDICTEYKGRKYYFCCEGCKKQFEKDPEKYAGKYK